MEEFDFRDAMQDCLHGKFLDELPAEGRVSLVWVQNLITRLVWNHFVVDQQNRETHLRQLDEDVRGMRGGESALRAHGVIPELPGETSRAYQDRLKTIARIVLMAARGEKREIGA